MRLADDERGRVPFALIGVLLLLGSVAVATVQLDSSRVNQNAALAGDRAEAAAETTLRDAVRDAGARAAANPVLSPASTAYGDVLDSERPYRSYLELLIAIELRERLDGTPQRVGNATAVAALAPIDDPSAARDAIERVDVAANRRGMVGVTVRDVQFEIRRAGSTVATRERTLSVNVTTPALTLHERTRTFDARLSEGTLRPGTLNRGLTGSLWGFAWARGYAQYAGVPFENVVTNDHVELLTNLAALDVQQSVFGRSDEQAEDRLADRTAEVVQNEALGVARRAFEAAALPTNRTTPIEGASVDSPDPAERTIGVNVTADRALADVVAVQDGADGELVLRGSSRPWTHRYEAILTTAASVDAGLLTTRDPGAERLVAGDVPGGPNWEHAGVVGQEDPTVERVQQGAAQLPAASGAWSVERTAERTATLVWNETVRYRNGADGDVQLVELRYRQPVDVGVALLHRPAQRSWIPDAGVATQNDGRYARLIERANERLIEDSGGLDGVATTVAEEGIVSNGTTVSPSGIDGIADPAYDEVAAIRDDARSITTTASPAHALTEDQTPIADLAGIVRDRSHTYRDVPDEYESLDERAAVALRAVYVERLLERLDGRAGGSTGAREDISDRVGSMSAISEAGLGDFFEVGMDYTRPDPRSIETRPPAPDLELTVDADPSYLSTAEVNRTRAPAPQDPYYPLAARTTTISSLPTDAITEKITDLIASIFGGDPKKRAPLTVAARTLVSASAVNDTEAAEHGFGGERNHLHRHVEEEVVELNDTVAGALSEETPLDEVEAKSVVDDAVAIYDGPGATVLAYDEGATPERIVELAVDRHDVDDSAADRARTVIRNEYEEYLAEKDSTVPLHKVDSVAKPTRELIRSGVQTAVEQANEQGEELLHGKILDKTGFSMLPSRGFPVAPVPSWWVVTANVWHVEVQGSYSSFAVRAEQGGPSGGSHVSYVRDGQPVVVDVNGDGRPEHLGRSDRITFYATSTVAVAVPRGGGGVGNNGTGLRTETDGWDHYQRTNTACTQGRSNQLQRAYELCQDG